MTIAMANVNDQEVFDVIDKIANHCSKNGAFAYFESSDVGQEVWCMCLEAIDKYDPSKGKLEHFLRRHVANRIKNLKRDKYFRPGFDVSSSGHAKTRMNLVNALPLDQTEDVAHEGIFLSATCISIRPEDHMMCQETITYVRDRLPDGLRIVMDSVIGKNHVRKPLRDELKHKVAEILVNRQKEIDDGGYEDQETLM